ncbi:MULTISPECIES: hypothetical protein [Streptomyces]|uniref:Uncharacterized protein n=1 Tax=Streptomyces lasiicapitis TaxID=1923961 RepID=A0ABQ2LZ62_9ACTN|nr:MULTISPECIES: hypothetical protein [Streptomyces]GGO44946.1 hypothetical protein GCM10012286_32390 [Streptomyces lasiicapitis]
MTTKRKRLPGAGHFLLLAALLLGIVTMHTLGHPREHGPSAERATAAAHARVGPDGGHARATADSGHAGAATVGGHAPKATVGGHAQARADQRQPHGTGGGEHTTNPPSTPTDKTPHDPAMDPLSLCLAVLGAALTLALLYAAVHRGPWGTPVHVQRLARVLDTLRPNPPPPRTLLAHLSVLRV